MDRERLARVMYESNPISTNTDENGKLLGYFRNYTFEEITSRANRGVGGDHLDDIYSYADAILAADVCQ